MNKRSFYCGALAGMVLTAGSLSSFGQQIFKEDFQKKTPVKFWTASGKYKINFMGLTSENAPAGRKVFKLDISFLKDSWGYYYFKIPCKFMPKGDFKLKTRVLLGKESTGQFGLGFNAFFPEFGRSGCRKLGKGLKTTNNKWLNVNIDAGEWFCKGKENFAKKYSPVADAADLSPNIDGIVLFLFGLRNKNRVVLYLDEVEVMGDTIAKQDWKKLQKKRWARVVLKQNKMIEEYRMLLDDYVKAAGESTYGDKCARFLQVLEKKQKRYGVRFILNKDDYKRILRNIADLKSADNTKLSDNALIYILDNPITNTMIVPDGAAPLQAKLGGKEIKVVAAKGEFESFSVLVKAMKKLDKLTVLCDDLRSRSGAVIPAANIDLKSVKCWYQSGSAWYGYNQSNSRKITPELLLNDDSLVKIDHKLKTNFIKLRFAGGDKYWNVDDPKWNKKRGTGSLPIDKFPIRDTKKLLPLVLNTNHLKQFWGTVKVPKKASAGIYSGSLKVMNDNEVLAKITLKLRVLPFELPTPKTRYSLKEDFISSIFYRTRYNPKYPEGSVSSENRSLKQIAAELKNMREHNIYNPNCYQGWGNKDALAKVLKLRNAAGMKGLPIYYVGFITAPSWANKAVRLAERVKATAAFMKKFDVPGFYCFGVDEAHGKRLLNQLDVWRLVHKAGGKIFSTGTIQNLQYIADKTDIQVLSGKPEKIRAELWKTKNKKLKLLAYAWPQGGVEDPVINRRGLGMTTWLANYDGTMTYAYMHSMGNGWNDFDHSKYREHNYVYPTTEGVISTLGLVGFRESIDDIRYATKLRQLIAKHQNGSKAKLAATAQAYLDDLSADGDLHLIRLEMTNYIIKLLK
jgi:hypothetical protein